jgi:hypothetical protein
VPTGFVKFTVLNRLKTSMRNSAFDAAATREVLADEHIGTA